MTLGEAWCVLVLGAALGGPPAVALFEGLAVWRAARAERRCGEISAELEKHQGPPGKRPRAGTNTKREALKAAGLSKSAAHRCERIWQVPEENFEAYLAECRERALRHVISANVHRRHLDETQRGMIAGRLATLRDGQRRPKGGSNDLPPSQAEAASLLRVSVPTVKRARTVLESGDAELIAACERGEKRLRRMPQDRQSHSGRYASLYRESRGYARSCSRARGLTGLASQAGRNLAEDESEGRGERISPAARRG